MITKSQNEMLFEYLSKMQFKIVKKKKNAFLAERTVAGEITRIAFYIAESEEEYNNDDLTNFWTGAQSKYKLRFIGPKKTQELAKSLITITNATASTLDEYFNETFDSINLANIIIKRAEDIIPKSKYIEQDVMLNDGSTRTAIKYLETIKTNKDGGKQLLILLAPGGYGKTSLAYTYARLLAETHLKDSHEPIPFIISLSRHRKVKEYAELILTTLEDEKLIGIYSNAFAYLVNIGKIIPILDGFDELAETGGMNVARGTLKELCNAFDTESNSKIFVTSRETFFKHRGDTSIFGKEGTSNIGFDFDTVDLQPFTEDQSREFLKLHNIPNELLDDYMSVLKIGAETGIDNPLGNPLMLDTLARGLPPDKFKQVDWQAEDIFELCVKEICKREYERHGEFNVQQQTDILTQLADWAFLLESYNIDDIEDLLRSFASKDLSKDMTTEQKEEMIGNRLLRLKSHALFSTIDTGKGFFVNFVHPFFRDYFLSLSLKKLITEEKYVVLAKEYFSKKLPEFTKAYIIKKLDLAPCAFAFANEIGIRFQTSFKEFFGLALQKCDSEDQTDINKRTIALNSIFKEDSRVWQFKNLENIELRSLKFSGFIFRGCDFSDSIWRDIDIDDSKIEGCTFYKARWFGGKLTPDIYRAFESGGGDYHGSDVNESEVEIKNPCDDPIIYLLQKVFNRFSNQNARKEISFYNGLAGQEVKFTRKEILPLLVKNSILIKDEKTHDNILIYDSMFRDEFNSLFETGTIAPELKQILDTLNEKAKRYYLS